MFSSRKTAAPSSGYNLTKSLRFRASASAYMNRTPGVAGNQKTWTVSFWCKRTPGANQDIFSPYYGGDGSNESQMYFRSDDTFQVYDSGGNAGYMNFITTQVFRDPSAWYHIVVAVDTTQATAGNRFKLYVNGSQVTSFSTSQTQNQNNNTGWNNTSLHKLGSYPRNTTQYFDGYLCEVYNIDGQQLTPSSFGSTNATTGVWQPAKYTGTYGTNGFYLPFTNTTSTTTLGYDSSGNSNNFTVNNISLTAGSTYDSMTDVPTLTSATVSNYAVMNPLISLGYTTLADGNLKLTGTGTVNSSIVSSTIGVSSGKWYWEQTVKVVDTAFPRTGVTSTPLNNNGTTVGNPDGYGYWADGRIWKNGSNVTTVATFAANDVLGFAFDATNLTLAFYKNNSLVYTMTGLTAASTFFPADTEYNTSSSTLNFGQQPFAYTPPTGFVALNTYNLPTSTIVKGNTVMDATLYTGNGSTQTITNAAGFKPDFVWVKSRSAATDHKLTDSVRGVQKGLISDTTGAETTDTNGLTAFNSNGWSLGSDTVYNNNTATYVGWQWQAGQGSTSSNTSGSITSTVSVNASAGFSVVTYTGTGANATVGHGLGVAPSMMIVKGRTDTNNWFVYHVSVGNTGGLILNTTNAAVSGSGYWQNTSPTSSVFSIGNNSNSNSSTIPYVIYCWAPIAGYSAFGSYTGNGSTSGPFIYTGFQPRFILVKETSSANAWVLVDSARNPYNSVSLQLYPNLTNGDGTDSAFNFLSNGFQLTATSSNTNASGQSYIYAAFASNPFKNSLAF